jgi:(2Fe-2S) ferredoxin
MKHDVIENSDNLTERLERVGIGSYSRHILLCVGESCSKKQPEGLAEETWIKLKNLLSANKLTPGAVFRTKCHCLRVCRQGPIGVVYPEGVWYADLTPQNIERVVREHLMENKVVTDLLIAKNPLKESSVFAGGVQEE